MIGIYGGTFNPIHLGHLRAAEEIIEALELDELLLVPCANPPHKHASVDDEIAPAELRLEWLRRAIEGNPRLRVDPIEIERSGTSYLIDTLEALRERHPGESLVFAVGQDAFAEMGSWRSPERIFALANVLVTTRPPDLQGGIASWLPECVADAFEVDTDGCAARHREAGSWIRYLRITALDISASDVRARLRAGRSIRYLVPDSVEAAIRSSGCYTSAPEPETRAHRGEMRMNDATLQSKTERIVAAALELNAEDIVAIDIHELSAYADHFVIVTARSDRHVRAVADAIVKTLRDLGEEPLGVEGVDEGRWVLIDANDVVVHVFDPDTRDLYDLERLWSDAPRVALTLPDRASQAGEVAEA